MKRIKLQEGAPPAQRMSRDFPQEVGAAKVGPLRSEVTTPPDLITPLTDTEKEELNHCEETLQKGLGTFFEVGNALLTIREAHLYRARHATFENYCRERWGIGRSYAWRVIGAAERLKLLPPGGSIPRPSNEFQVRPFLKLQPEAFPNAWAQAVERSKDGKITSSVVQSLIAEMSASGDLISVAGRGAKRRKRPRRGRVGEALTWLYEIKRRVEKGEADQALVAIERLEDILQRHLCS